MALSIVTGASTGIGRAIAVRLSNIGHNVLAVARNKSKLIITKENGNPDKIYIVAADITTPDGRQIVVKEVKKHGGKGVQYLVQNAGSIGPIGPLLTVNEKEWRDLFDVNLHAHLFLVQALYNANAFLTGDEVRILHMSSAAAHSTMNDWGAYCVSKSAFHMLHRCLQDEFKATHPNILVSSVRPGIVESPIQQEIRGFNSRNQDTQQFFKNLKENQYRGDPDKPHPPPRNGLDIPANVAFFCEFLLERTTASEFTSKEHDIHDEATWPRWTEPL